MASFLGAALGSAAIVTIAVSTFASEQTAEQFQRDLAGIFFRTLLAHQKLQSAWRGCEARVRITEDSG